ADPRHLFAVPNPPIPARSLRNARRPSIFVAELARVPSGLQGGSLATSATNFCRLESKSVKRRRMIALPRLLGIALAGGALSTTLLSARHGVEPSAASALPGFRPSAWFGEQVREQWTGGNCRRPVNA